MERQAKDRDTGILDGDVADDDFFGSQEEGKSEFGALCQHENLAKGNEFQTLGYFESYDETNEILLQEGFETGYRQTFEAALRLGKHFGKLSAQNELVAVDNAPESSDTASRLHAFLAKFQNRPTNMDLSNAKESIELLEQELFG